MVSKFDPFPHKYALWRLCSRPLFENLRQKKKLLKTRNFSFCHHDFTFIELLFFHLKGFSVLFPKHFQSNLLQIYCRWERVNKIVLLFEAEDCKDIYSKLLTTPFEISAVKMSEGISRRNTVMSFRSLYLVVRNKSS